MNLLSHGRRLLLCVSIGWSIVGVLACTTGNSASSSNRPDNTPSTTALEKAQINKVPVIHVFVALADNVNQGIVPVSKSLGNGDNPVTNLYWGAAFGVKTFFSRSRDWQLILSTPSPRRGVLERSVFKHRRHDVYLIADAYQGKQIAQTTADFLEAAAGVPGEKLKVNNVEFNSHGSAELIAYVGHNRLMDFKLNSSPSNATIVNVKQLSSPARVSSISHNRSNPPGP